MSHYRCLLLEHLLLASFLEENHSDSSWFVMYVSDCVGSHSRDHLSDLLHRPVAPERQTNHVGGQCWSGQDHPCV